MAIFIPKWQKFKEKPLRIHEVDWSGIAGEYGLESFFIRDVGESVHLYKTPYVFDGNSFSIVSGAAKFGKGTTEVSIVANVTPAALPIGNDVFVCLGGIDYQSSLAMWVDNEGFITTNTNCLSVNFAGTTNRVETLQNSIVAGKSTDVSASYDGAASKILVTHDSYVETVLDNGTIPTTFTGGNDLYLGGGATYLNNYNGSINHLMVFKRYVPDFIIEDLKSNPYQILKPRKTYFVLGGAGGSSEHSLSLSDSTANAAAETAQLTQTHSINLANSASAASADEVAITQNHALQLTNAVASAIADAIAVSVGSTHTLSLANASANAQSDSFALQQQHNFTLADANASAAADSLAIIVGSVHQLTFADSSAASQSDALALQQQHSLLLADLAAVSQADTLAVIQTQLFSFADAIVNSHAGVLVISQGSVINLVLSGAVASSSLDTIEITQTQALQLSGAVAASIAQSLAISQNQQLILSGADAQAIADSLNTLGNGIGLILAPSVKSVTTKRTIYTLH